MKLKICFVILSVIALSLTLVFFSCETENTDNVSTEEVLKAINENAKASAIFKDAFNEANDATIHAEDSLTESIVRGQFTFDNEPQLTITPFDLNSWPKNIIVDYGTENLICEDMRERRGKINITASDFYHKQACTLTITFENYYQDNNKVEGTKTIINQGENSNGNLVFDIKVENGRITTPDNTSFVFEENTSREWAEGSESINPWDDVYYITGSQNGTSSDSIDYTLNIDNNNPLNVLIGCRWIRAGILNIHIENTPSITLDYGQGVCDNSATATVSGDEYMVNMQ